MIIFEKEINYLFAEKVTDEKTGERFYKTESGEILPSVTTILSKTKNSQELENWKKNLGSKAEEIKIESTNIGSLVHKHLENFIMGIERPEGSNFIRKLSKSMSDLLIENLIFKTNKVIGIEQELWFPGLYAGTADIILYHNNTLAIGDFKTSKIIKKDEFVEDYKIQTVAYAMAHNELYNTNINKTIIFMVSRNLEYKEWIVEKEEFFKLKDIWLDRLEKFYDI